MNFIEYSYWCGLPSIAAGTALFVMLWLIFVRQIPIEIIPLNIDATGALKNKRSAIISSILLTLSLIALVALSFTEVPVWVATLPFALLMLLADILTDLFDTSSNRSYARLPSAVTHAATDDNSSPSIMMHEINADDDNNNVRESSIELQNVIAILIDFCLIVFK